MATHDTAVKPAAAPKPASEPVVQRKCDCGGAASGSCHDCDRKRLHRSATGAAPATMPAAVDGVLASSGEPLDPSLRREMETRFGHDFADVRIHRDSAAAESALSLGALAWTSGAHVAFGTDRYSPATPDGRRLLGHELTHVVQQRHDRALQRQSAVSEPGDPAEREADRMSEQVMAPAAGGFLVDDDAAAAGTGQMRRTEFLDELQRASCAAADAELARVERSTEGCPFVERAFSRFRGMPAAQVERAVRRYVDAGAATSARDYIPLVSARVSAGVARWATSGEMPDLPPELAAGMGDGGGVLSMLGGGLASIAGGIGRLFLKRDEGASPVSESDPSAVASQLGRGASLDIGVRDRMEGAYGYDFSQVRVHTDDRAAGLSASLGARAFTVGRDVAFGASEYRPGTPSGDALIAHELAHVVQQSGGGSDHAPAEGDADRSAAAVMLSLWGGAKQIARSALPRARSGLALHRCGGSRPAVANPPQRATAPSATEIARMPPFQLSELQEQWLAGDALRDYARARLLILCLRRVHHIDFDFDNLPVVGRELTGAESTAASAARRTVVTGSAPFRPSGDVNEAPIRVIGGAQWAAKRYQLEMIVAGVGPRADEFVRELWPECNITPHAGATIVEQERKIAAFNSFVVTAGHTLGAFYHPYDNVIYLGDALARNLTSADATERTDAAQTVGHETLHSLGGRQDTLTAFRTRFPGQRWICFWSVFEEGMAEDEAMRSMNAGALRPDDVYEQHVNVMRAIMTALGAERVRRAYFSGRIDEDIFRELERRVPLTPGLRPDLPPACETLFP